MSLADFMRRKHINSPTVTNLQMRHPDVSSSIWRTKLAVSQVSGVGKHSLTNVFDPSTTATSIQNRAIQSFKSSGFGGRNQDVTNYVMTLGATSIRQDNFSGKLQTVTTGSASGCLTTTPASQVVSQLGNAAGSKSGLNMGYVSTCTPAFNPETQSQFVDTLPIIKRGLGVKSRAAWSGAKGTNYGSQMPFVCTTETTSYTHGNAKTSNLAGGLVPKDNIPLGKPDRPYNSEFAKLQTAPTGSQVGGGTFPGSRAPKVGGALRKVPGGINHRGVATPSKGLFTPYRLNNGLKSLPAINNPPGQA